MNRKFKQWW